MERLISAALRVAIRLGPKCATPKIQWRCRPSYLSRTPRLPDGGRLRKAMRQLLGGGEMGKRGRVWLRESGLR